MKKVVSVILAFSVMLMLCFTASAVSTYDLESSSKYSSLSISAGEATLVSRFSGTSDVTHVEITQTLEKHSFLWFWDTIGGAWIKRSDDRSVLLTTYRSGLASGTYRVKSIFTVTTSNGKTETVTVYSAEKTI